MPLQKRCQTKNMVGYCKRREGHLGKHMGNGRDKKEIQTGSMGVGEIEAIVREVIKAAEGRKASIYPFGKAGCMPETVPFAAANGGMVPATMPLALAVKIIENVEAKAAEWGMRVVCAVSDASARPVAVHCMDGAYIGSFDVALNKTYTSIAFQMSTARLGTLSQPGESLYGIQFTNENRIVIFGGGELLKQDDAIVGALGVSGGTAEQDTALAAFGKAFFENM